MFDDFESYSIGSIHGQGGWEGWTGIAGAAGSVTTAVASSGTKSLRLIAGNDTVRPFSGVTSGKWTLSIEQYIPSTSSGSHWTILLNRYPNNLNWSVQTLADLSQGLIGEFDGSGGTGQHGVTLQLVKDAWIPLRYEIDLDANSVSAYYNNTLMGTHPWQYNGVNALAAIDLYPDEGSGTIQVGPVYYDNLRLEIVPEPAVTSLLLLGGLAFFIRPRKQA